MIINNTYFKGELYIPEAKPSITSDVKDVEISIRDFIGEYVQDCLFKCLGSKLSTEFISMLDSNNQNGLKDAADAKWDDLLNGKSYTDPQGNEVVWRGIRWKSRLEGDYDKSFLAAYVYFFYETNYTTHRTGIGNAKVDAVNAMRVSGSHKVVRAWRKFVGDVQGNESQQPYFEKEVIGRYQYDNRLIGADYYRLRDNNQVSLYQFITDQNNLVADTYEGFNPKFWGSMNNLGI